MKQIIIVTREADVQLTSIKRPVIKAGPEIIIENNGILNRGGVICRLQIAGRRSQVAGCRLQFAVCSLQFAGWNLKKS